jgi:glycosyltransferase involved in cell wall biosynthesis
MGHLRVLFLIRSFGFPQGMAATNRVGLLGRALVVQGADVSVLCLRVSDRPGNVRNASSRGVWQGIRYTYTPGTTMRADSFITRRWRESLGYAKVVLELRRLQRAGDLDCAVFADNVLRWHPTQWFLRCYLSLMGVPIVVQLNEVPGAIKWLPRGMAKSFSHLSNVAGVITISSWLTDWVDSEARQLGRMVQVLEVPIVVDVREREVSPYPHGSRTLLYAASTEYGRDARFVLRVMSIVWSRHPDCRLVVTGMDPERVKLLAELEGVATALDDGHIVPKGYLPRERLLAEYAQAAALLAPLHDDLRSLARFPSKLGEYLVSARPVVTTNVGEIGRFLRDGETAFVALENGVDAFAAKIGEVVEDSALAAAVGLAGRRVAEESFDYELQGPRLIRFLEQVCRADA